MAETMRSLTTPAEDAAGYQPLALFSILSVSTAGLFTGLVVILTVVGLYTRKPVLEPLLILLAVGGIVLSVAARWQIRNSEGTLAGTGIAKLALWLCVIFGACYIAYFYGNALAIQQQAKDYVQNRWLKAISDGDLDEAAFLSIPPDMRRGMTKRDVSSRFGVVSGSFAHLELVHILRRAGADFELTPVGVKEWKQTNEGYEVVLNYTLRTREGEFNLVFAVLGVEGKDFAERQWVVKTGVPYIQSRRLTTYGRMLVELQTDGNQFLQDWLMNRLANLRFTELYLNSLELTQAQRNQKYGAYVAQALVGNGLAAATIPGGGLTSAAVLGAQFGDMNINRQTYLAGFGGFANQLVYFDERVQQQPAAVKDELLRRIINPANLTVAMATKNMESPTELELLPDGVHVSLPIDVVLPAPANYRAGGKIVAVCWSKDVNAALRELASAPWNAKQPLLVDSSPSALKGYQHDWRIAQVYIDLARRRDDQRPGGGPQMMDVPPP